MKKGFYVGLIIVLVFAFILNLKKVERPKEAESAKQTVQAISQAVAQQPKSETYQKLPDEIDFCGEHLILDESKKQKLAEILDKESKSYTSKRIREIIERNMWYTYLKYEPTNTDFPEDLKYVVFAESKLDTTAESSKNAIGPWQFMRETAKLPGLDLIVEPENNYDERYDFIKSTKAAKKLLKKLREDFGNWPTALAAYNTGEKNLQEAMDRENARDFFQLRTIAAETQDFPFRVLAIKLIFQNSRLRDPFSQNRWPSSNKYEGWEIIPLELKVRTRSSINRIIEVLRKDYPDLDYKEFTTYNRQVLGDLPAGTYTAYIVQKRNGTS